MKLGWLIFFFMCVMTTAIAAMVPRNVKRSQPTTTNGTYICAPTTPCAWSIYNPHVKIIEMNITNNYCICDIDQTCEVYEDDTGASSYVYRCMKPAQS